MSDEYRGYVFGFSAWPSPSTDRPDRRLTKEETDALSRAGKRAIDLIEAETGLSVGGQWGPWRDNEPWPLASMSTDYQGECCHESL